MSHVGNSAEMAYISSVRVRLFEAPSGVLRLDAHGPTSPPFVEAGLTDRGVVLAATACDATHDRSTTDTRPFPTASG